jgi:tripartite-type tricarboxylate transporter receptor subunit TctC
LKWRPFEEGSAIADRIPFNREAAMRNRRTFMQLAAAAVGGFLLHRGASAAENLRMLIGFGPGSPADIGARLIQTPFARAMGMTAVQVYIGGEGGALAALEIIRSGPDGRALLVADPFTLCLLDAEGAGLLPKLKPIAGIGGGLSCALVVRDDSPLKDWASLTAAARGPTLLAMANNDRMSAYLSAKDLMQKRAGLIFQPFVAGSAQAILDRVLTQQSDLGTIDTRLALLHNEKAAASDKVRILATFGALRAPELPDVPTFAEIVGDPKAAYTTSVAVFCSPGADAAFASRATAALLSLADNEAMRQDARQLRFPLRIEGPESVQATIARDSRVIRDLYG